MSGMALQAAGLFASIRRQIVPSLHEGVHEGSSESAAAADER